jgi:hypothetical protein
VNRHRIAKTLTAASAITALTVAAPAPAFAADTTTTVTRRSGLTRPTTDSTRASGAARDQAIAQLKVVGKAEIDRRLATLTALSVRVAQGRHLSSSDRARLTNEIANEKSGLTSLRTKIDGDTDLATLRSDLHAIVADYRVYVLVVPQVRLTAAADAVLDVTDRFATVDGRLAQRLAEAKAKGTDVTALEGLLADASSTVDAARSLAAAIPDQLAALTPAGYPGNRPTLLSARQSLRQARVDLRGARVDVRQVVDGLRAASAGTTTTT